MNAETKDDVEFAAGATVSRNRLYAHFRMSATIVVSTVAVLQQEKQQCLRISAIAQC
jgi:hypothetical protein